MNPFFTRCLTFGLSAALTLTTAAASAETVKIAYGDNAIDTARVIKILEGEGFLEVDPSVGYSAELKDITKYNYDIELVPVTSTTLVGTLDDAGSDLYIELVEFDLYNLPNEALHSGDIDMHACVTQTYFESDAAAQGFDNLSLLGYTIIAPLSLYSHKVNSVQELKDLAAK